MAVQTEKVNSAVSSLLDYAVKTELIGEYDRRFFVNTFIDLLKLDAFDTTNEIIPFPDCLEVICDYACECGLIENTQNQRDLFDTRVMGLLTPRPSEVIRRFRELSSDSVYQGTEYFYKLSQDCNYIRRDRIAKDERWKVDTKYGELEISINLSKPEKDPRDIAAAKLTKASGYPKCLLCIDNEGFSGHAAHPARENLRIIPLEICGERWGFQYSPYVYYNEHCIVMNSRHVPMVIDDAVFYKLFSFVEQFPHYFVGSNADLPIVGGSILSHEHFQGGHYDLPMKNAKEEYRFTVKGFEDVSCSVLHYPMTALRLSGEDQDAICRLASKILRVWRGYSDPEAYVFAETDGEIHNTITPIARKRELRYELDLVLRNNITTDEHPLGVFHPHAHLHHIKKENIGLIEVQGLAILPGRLKKEMQLLENALLAGTDLRSIPELEKHADWAEGFMKKNDDFNKANASGIIRNEIGLAFSEVLECAGVFKCTEDGRKYLNRFLEKLNEV